MKTLALFLLASCPCFAQELIKSTDVVGVETTKQVKTFTVDIDGDGSPDFSGNPKESVIDSRKTKAKLIEIDSLAANIRVSAEDRDRNPARLTKLSNHRYLITKPGKYWIRVTAIDFENNIFDEQSTSVTLGKPKPKTMVADGLHVLIVYETENLTREKYVGDIISSPVIRNYITSKSGNGNNFRFFDQDTKFTECDGFWCKAMARERKSVPWVLIRNDKHMHEGPLPKSVDELLKLLKRFGG